METQLAALGLQNLRDIASNPLHAVDALGAQTDVQAVAIWIRAKGSRTVNTFETYRREAIRLLLWLKETGLSLKDMKVDHVHHFFSHLSHPPAHWLRPRKPHKGVPLAPTQVLTGPLSAASLTHTRTILGGMCAYLLDAGYVPFNVFKLSMKPALVIAEYQERALHLESWFWLWEWVCTRSADDARGQAQGSRARWLFALLYHSGIRREEAARGVMGDFVRTDTGWFLQVTGKGNKQRRVAVNAVLLQELRRYRQSWGLSDLPHPAEQFPLVATINAKAQTLAMTPRTIGLIIQNLAKQAAANCDDPHIGSQITRLSTHWLRHTNATHRLAAGASLETTQDELGHSDPRTTRIYAKTIDSKRHEDAQKLVELQNAGPSSHRRNG